MNQGSCFLHQCLRVVVKHASLPDKPGLLQQFPRVAQYFQLVDTGFSSSKVKVFEHTFYKTANDP